MTYDKDSFLAGLAVGRMLWRPPGPGIPVANAYLSFASESNFTLSIANSTKNWDGILEYSTDEDEWTEWDGTTPISSDYGQLYLRGTGNTYITKGDNKGFILSGMAGIYCAGNIEALLDYATVESGLHPTMKTYTYRGLFKNNTALVSAPDLPARTIKFGCYYEMFYGCTALAAAPDLPAKTLEGICYASMFANCTSLRIAPVISATAAGQLSCNRMFLNCTSLKKAPDLPATTLGDRCYSEMFFGCVNLEDAPALPATTLTERCYYFMFGGCASLKAIPELPALVLQPYCYGNMFGLIGESPPEYPQTRHGVKADDTQQSVFQNAYRVPASGTGTDADHATYYMFESSNNLPYTPAINTTFYVDRPAQS